MHTQKIFPIFILLIISIVAERDKKKICVHNLVINGTNLLLSHRKQLLVLGVINFQNQSSRIQANRYNDLYRELEHHDIREPVARLILINEQTAATYFPGNLYGKIRLYQDSPRDQLVRKLRGDGPITNNYVFGRCGFQIFSQEQRHSNLDDGKNYQELLRVITTAVKNKRRCLHLCS